ncbi:vinorine synthase-like [Melia azedarach]|uniref:Epi-neemfruitin B synthase L1AT n=2 Tax=Melia azedarach TaxID=155640 RepID=L1AT_MELAZ|nr:vinorine synthase-like [Melia azedarach]WBW48725.1 L1AT [Melia azedarach]
MELKIVSSEIIKPSSPTPQHLRTHKLSVLDQVAGDSLFPVILFYPQACSNDTTKTSDHLKKSLSETLSKYHPFAGRFKDAFSIDCDDSGAVFVEACVAGEMSEILKQPKNDLLEELMPYKLNEKPSVPVNLAAKVTYFGCGGMALCVCFSHVIADITTAANFIKSWVAISRGFSTSNDIPDTFFDCSTVFPPQDFSSFSRNAFADNHSQSAEIITKRFTFDGVKLADLKEKIRKESSSGYQPTRVEAVSAVILGGIMSAEKEGEKFNHTNLVPSVSVNLRNRTNPPLPELSIGNIIQAAITKLPIEKRINYSKLTEQLHGSIRSIDDEYLKKFHAVGEFMNNMQNALIALFDPNNRGFTISSWCRRPLYEADFGWGKPIWVSTAMKHKDVAVLLDSNDGKGIEALVALPKKEMDKFEQDPGILAYASVDTSII